MPLPGAHVERDVPGGLTSAQRERLAQVWDRWHLNDMRAGCEHQRDIDTTEEVEVTTYKLTREAWACRKAAEKAATDAAIDGRAVELRPVEKALMRLDHGEVYSPPDADSPLSGCYEVDKRERKAIGWVRPNEHPRGMLCAPCPTCGYKYGSAWLHEDVPADVIAWLESLPETDRLPACWAN